MNTNLTPGLTIITRTKVVLVIISTTISSSLCLAMHVICWLACVSLCPGVHLLVCMSLWYVLGLCTCVMVWLVCHGPLPIEPMQ